VGADHSIAPFTVLADLASARVGGRAVAASDEFFAPKANLIKPAPAIFVPGRFTTRGKWMDGWESRRRRTPGHDWCVVLLGIRGVVRGVDVDTSHFTGNHPARCSIDALDSARSPTAAVIAVEGAPWQRILPDSPLRGDAHNLLAVEDARPWTHVRLNIVPDGGVARLRVYGEAAVDWHAVRRAGRAVDLASIRLGGLVLGASDAHFGGRDNMIMPGRARNMGDGWETRRRRGPGHDWAIVRLGAAGSLTRIEIDTNHFKGNYPESASVDGCFAPVATLDALRGTTWTEVLPRTPLRPDRRHFLTPGPAGPVTHVRLNIFPDGGVSRLRVHGTVHQA
jgi:allantoicase